MPPLVITFGVSVILQSSMLLTVSTANQNLDAGGACPILQEENHRLTAASKEVFRFEKDGASYATTE